MSISLVVVGRDLRDFVEKEFGNSFSFNVYNIPSWNRVFVCLLKGSVDVCSNMDNFKLGNWVDVDMGSRRSAFHAKDIKINSIRALAHKGGCILTPEGKEVFKKIGNFIKDNFGYGSDSGIYDDVSYTFNISGNYEVINRQGTIAKPTKIDHKTAKRPKRRSVVESYVTVEDIIRKTSRFLERKFTGCDFDIYYADMISEISIVLKKADFMPLIKPHNSDVVIEATDSFEDPFPDNLDYRKVKARSPHKLTSQGVAVFADVVRFIEQNIKEGPTFTFAISKDCVISGYIAKPTKIDHKTAKKPKRRSVAEAILTDWRK